MPVYEYECENCSLRFEKVQRFSEDPVRECPDCGGTVHRIIQPVGVIFKGSGFYVTDNRGKSSTMPSTKREGESKDEGATKDGAGVGEEKTSKPGEDKTSKPAAAKSTEGAAAP